MIEFALLDILSKFHRKVIVSYYTQSRACSKESGETEHSVYVAAHAKSGVREHDDRHHTWQASMFLLPARDSHCVGDYPPFSGVDDCIGRSRATGDGLGI